MKSLYESLLDDFNDIEKSFNPFEEIEKFIKDNYSVSANIKISKKPNKEGLYEVSCSGSVFLKKQTEVLTNDLFTWKKVKNDFFCDASNIESLKGAPKEVGRIFNCNWCIYLTSLEGMPEKCKAISCSYCDGLTNLKGAPKEIDGGFACCGCGLTSLEGAPEKVGGIFDCSANQELTSLKGAPKEVGKGFKCSGCKKLISLDGMPEKILSGTFSATACGKEFTKIDVIKRLKSDSGLINMNLNLRY